MQCKKNTCWISVNLTIKVKTCALITCDIKRPRDDAGNAYLGSTLETIRLKKK